MSLLVGKPSVRGVFGEEYSVLDALPQEVLLLCYGGSYAYGTNVETSDIDIRGVAMETNRELLGLQDNFWEYRNHDLDISVSSFTKIVNSLIEMNPNTLEMFGLDKSDYLKLDPILYPLLDDPTLYLSMRCRKSFGKYAEQQLSRLQNAVARDRVDEELKEKHILGALLRAKDSFNSRYQDFGGGKINIYVGESGKQSISTECKIDISLTDYPLREFNSILNEFTNILRTYGKLNHRNKKKDDAHLNKHAMHLIRLYLMGIELLERGVVRTQMKEIELLMSIREGKYLLPDGTYHSSFFDIVREFETRFNYACKNSCLPEVLDTQRLEEYVMYVRQEGIKRNGVIV